MEALYSKYRPKVFSDVVGQKHILQTLQNAVSQNKISHAYMFCGPRGTGKTTMARLLAKACMCMCASDGASPSVNFCGKCQDCEDIAKGIHPDVYELDAASRTGVENVREEIISRVGFAATRGNKKIYIIDEVHMLSTAAFNALLKTLEEPPSHVIFILCTTDPQKVPETILSRCQRFNFSAISANDIFDRLKFVCDAEGINAEDKALETIAQYAEGAMRNALTNLEQAIAFSDGNVSLENLNQTMSVNSQLNFAALIENLGMRNLPEVFNWIDEVSNFGVDYMQLCANVVQIFRDMYVKCVGGNVDLDTNIESSLTLFSSDRLHRDLLILNDLETALKTSTNLRLSFEIAMAKICNPKSDLTIESLAERVSNLELVATAGDLSPAFAIENKQQPEKQSSTAAAHAADDAILDDDNQDDEIPRKVVKVIKEEKQEEKDEIQLDEGSEIKMPERPQATDFSAERQNLKAEANIADPQAERKNNLENPAELQKLWHNAFSKIRNKYPAFGATLLTATPSYENLSNQFILHFPGSASFSVGVLKKPESMEKIQAEIKAVMGDDIGFNIVIDQNSEEGFNPQFSNKFRSEKTEEPEVEPAFSPSSSVTSQMPAQTPAVAEPSAFEDENLFPEEEPATLEQATDRSSITDMLNNFGAYNITEE